MAPPSLTTVIVVGAVVGLLFVAFGYAQLVWLTRNHQAHEASQAQRTSPLRTWLMGIVLFFAAALVLRSLASSSLTERSAFLAGEGLVSVRPRPGLVPRFEPSGVEVRQGDLLLRFAGEEGEDPRVALERRLELLRAELELERGRPLELDAELVRRAEAARVALENGERRMKLLTSERDAIDRERTQRRLDLAERLFRMEHEERDAQRELSELLVRVETERAVAKSDLELASSGALAQREAARGRDALTALEGRIAQLQDQHAIRSRARREVERLRSLTEETLSKQRQERSAELERERASTEAAKEALVKAQHALDQDRPRAVARQERRLRRLQLQLDDAQALLDGRGRQLNFHAPWDGRVGFREPSPSSPPADQGPLLVLYRPGRIAARVRLDPGEADALDPALHAQLQLSPSTPGVHEGLAPERALEGTVTRRTTLADGSGELEVAVDPPARIVRQLALGGMVPVTVRLRQPITRTTSFRAGLGFGGLALALALYDALRRRRAPKHREAVSPGAPRPPPPPPAPGASGADDVRAVLTAMRSWLSSPAYTPPALPARAGAEGGALVRADAFDESSALRALGLNLRMQVDGGLLTPALVRQVGESLSRGGYRAAALIAAGYGALTDLRAMELAALSLLASAQAGSPECLGEATRDCAQFLRVMRAISPNELSPSLDRLREMLIAATLEMAKRSGAPNELAGEAVTLLAEV